MRFATAVFVRTSGLGAALVVLVGHACGAPVGAAAAASSSVSEPPPLAAPLAESARKNARSFAEWLARNVDSWFGDHPFEDGGAVTQGKLSFSVFKRSDQDPDVDLRFDARFRLPNVERNAYLFVGRDDPREAAKDTPQTRSRQQLLQAARSEDTSLLAGLGISLPNDLDFRVGLGSRLKPYVRARYSQTWDPTPTQLLNFRETVFWTPDDRWGSTTVGSYALSWSPDVTVRWVNAVTVTQAARGLEWSSSLGAEHSFGAQQVLGLELLLNGRARAGVDAGFSDRGVLLRWEQPVYKQWLLAEVVAGHFWPRRAADAVRDKAWAVGAGLKLHF